MSCREISEALVLSSAYSCKQSTSEGLFLKNEINSSLLFSSFGSTNLYTSNNLTLKDIILSSDVVSEFTFCPFEDIISKPKYLACVNVPINNMVKGRMNFLRNNKLRIKKMTVPVNKTG